MSGSSAGGSPNTAGDSSVAGSGDAGGSKGDGSDGADGSGGSGGFGFGGSGGSAGAVSCMGVEIAVESIAVDMYIMLDQSGSMAEPLAGAGTDRWTGVVSGVQAFVSDPAAVGSGVGIQYFGLPDECNAAAYAIPEVPIGRLPEVADQIVDSMNAHRPLTLTPTYPALKGALDHMVSVAAQNATRAAVVVLITDGFPTRCSADGTPSRGATIQELQDLARQYTVLNPPIRTYVLGVGEALANLRSIAVGGGTGEPFLIESGDIQAQVLQAMLDITNKPLQCEFEIPDASSAGGVVDLGLIQLRFAATPSGQAEQIPKLSSLGDCAANGGEGWYYDSPAAPTRIVACPETCSKFGSGTVSINIGCRPVLGDRN